jgi:hypothetical protein
MITSRSLVIFALSLYLFPACSRSDAGETPNIQSIKNYRDHLCQTYDASKITRCDRSTFHVLLAWSCGQPLPTQYEYPSGKWNRDVEPCYPEESRSETSQDTYLGVILSQDKAALQRVWDYAEPRDWETGLPENGVGDIRALVPIMRETLRLGESDGIIDDGIEAAKKAFTGHRGHLLAGYLWSVSHLRGGLTSFGTTLLKKLHEDTPDSPYLSCLYRRHALKGQNPTLRLLKKVKPGDQFGWGSSIPEVHYALTVKCLEGM